LHEEIGLPRTGRSLDDCEAPSVADVVEERLRLLRYILLDSLEDL
jgi:hypothetical protein